jgi:DnaJ-class molecular chaperone
MTTKDYYKILEIDKNASKEEIKKAYRTLAIKWHPDKNKEDIALQKFKEISEAYQILYNDDKRAEYDNISNFKASKQRASYSNNSFHNLHNPFDFMFSLEIHLKYSMKYFP